jgi:hypothetical protein
MDSNPLRVIIRVRVMDIPSGRFARARCLEDSFCEQILRRKMNHDKQAKCHDADHCLPNFDSENDVKAWFLYDFNVKGRSINQRLWRFPTGFIMLQDRKILGKFKKERDSYSD